MTKTIFLESLQIVQSPSHVWILSTSVCSTMRCIGHSWSACCASERRPSFVGTFLERGLEGCQNVFNHLDGDPLQGALLGALFRLCLVVRLIWKCVSLLCFRFAGQRCGLVNRRSTRSPPYAAFTPWSSIATVCPSCRSIEAVDHTTGGRLQP